MMLLLITSPLAAVDENYYMGGQSYYNFGSSYYPKYMGDPAWTGNGWIFSNGATTPNKCCYKKLTSSKRLWNYFCKKQGDRCP